MRSNFWREQNKNAKENGKLSMRIIIHFDSWKKLENQCDKLFMFLQLDSSPRSGKGAPEI